MIAWHYTTGHHFRLIVGSSELRAADIGVQPPERPIIWFSFNQRWEQTASKALINAETGDRELLSMEDTKQLLGGLARFGVPAHHPKLHRWPKLAKKARMHREMARNLEDVAREQGADPREWAGMFGRFPVKNCIVEIMDANSMQWVRVQG